MRTLPLLIIHFFFDDLLLSKFVQAHHTGGIIFFKMVRDIIVLLWVYLNCFIKHSLSFKIVRNKKKCHWLDAHCSITYLLRLNIITDKFQHVWVVGHCLVANFLTYRRSDAYAKSFGSMCTVSLRSSSVLRLSRTAMIKSEITRNKGVLSILFDILRHGEDHILWREKITLCTGHFRYCHSGHFKVVILLM